MIKKHISGTSKLRFGKVNIINKSSLINSPTGEMSLSGSIIMSHTNTMDTTGTGPDVYTPDERHTARDQNRDTEQEKLNAKS